MEIEDELRLLFATTKEHSKQIEANSRLIEANSRLIEANGKQIDANSRQIEAHSRQLEIDGQHIRQLATIVAEHHEDLARRESLVDKLANAVNTLLEITARHETRIDHLEDPQ